MANKQTKAETLLVTLIADTTMRAAASWLQQRGIDPMSCAEALIPAMRTEAKAALGRVLDQGGGLIESGRSAWLEALVKTECAAAGIAAAKAVQ